MASPIILERFGEAPFTPAPQAVRAGDYIFTSSIYPIDAAGRALSVDDSIGVAGPTLIEVQTRAVLDALTAVLKGAGTTLDKVLKADVHLVDPTDFIDFRTVWKAYFPKDPPARTTVEIGDTLPFPGAKIVIDAVALAGDSKLERIALDDPEAPGASLVSEWAPHAVKAGNFAFCSAFPATDFKTGIPVGKRPGFPNYGSDAEFQAEYVFSRMDRVLKTGGTALAETIESQLYEPDLSTFHDIDAIWKKYIPLPPCRSSMGMKGVLVPGATFVPNYTVLVPDAEHKKVESFDGLRWHPAKVRGVNFSPTLKAGQWRFFAGQIASPDMLTYHHAPYGLPYHYSDIEAQTRFTMGLLTEQLEANQTDWSHCHHARVYLVQPKRDYRGFIKVWKEFFPDPAKAPALAFVPSSGIMFPGPLIEIDPTCVVKA